MAQFLGLGMSHYPGPLVPSERWPGMLRQGVKFGMVPADLYEDRSRWPQFMRDEWGSDGGVRAAAEHHARLMVGFRRMRQALDEFQPDVVLIWGDDQYENYKLDCIPPFCVGIHDEIVSYPYGGGRIPFDTLENVWGIPPETPLHSRGHYEAAHGLTSHLLNTGIDVSWARTLRDPAGLAHSFSNTIVYLDYERAGFPYPVVPVHVNCYGNHLVRGAAGAAGATRSKELAPPSPSPARCFAMGRETVRYFAPTDWRVALIGSSSWSHGNLTTKHHCLYPDSEADAERLGELLTGGFRDWGALPLARIEDSGQHEMLNWICLAGAMAELGRDAVVVDFVESQLFNSSKCFALFPA